MKLCWKKLDKLIIAPPPSNDAMSSPVVNPLQKGTAYDVISFESEVGVGEEELELEMNMPSNSPSSSTRRPMIQQSDNSLASNVVKFYHDKPGMFVFLVFCVPFILSTIALSANAKMGNSYTCSQSSSDELLLDKQKNIYSSTSNTAMVVSDNKVCTQVGIDVLEEGGLAADAAIAVAFCLGVVSPASSGIGGGCFMLNYDYSTKSSSFIDSRETAPAAADENMFVSDPMMAQHGGLAVAVLAEVKGLELAYNKFGSGSRSDGVSWQRLVQPAADLAEKWEIDEVVAHYLRRESKLLYSGKYPDWSTLYLDSSGRAKKVGDYVHQPQLAETLQMIAIHGSDYIYSDMADAIATDIQNAGGIITGTDIRDYNAIERTPVKTDIFGYEYVGAPPPSSGGATVATILSFIAGYAQPAISQGDVYFHRLIEGMKHAFALRMSLGDPAFMDSQSSAALNAMTNETYITMLRDKTLDDDVLPDLMDYGGPYSGLVLFEPDTDTDTATNDFRNMKSQSTSSKDKKKHVDRRSKKRSSEGLWAMPEDHGTTHLSVVDRHGNAASVTSTVNTLFGSKVISPSTGILLNNEMDDFSIPNASNSFGLYPSESNYVQPGKRPLSSMSPSILVEKSSGKVLIVGGASGGPRIITSTAQVILNYVTKGLDLISAVFSPRYHSQLLPDVAYIENRTITWSDPGPMRFEASQDSRSALQRRGHEISALSSTDFGCSQFLAVDIDSKQVAGGADPRKNGRALGTVP